MLLRSIPPASALAATALLGACALLTAPPPSVDVLDVRLVGIGSTEQQLALTLCVTNPGDGELAFRRVAAAVDIGGDPFADGGTEAAVRLPPHASTVVPFTVTTTIRNLGPQLLGVLRTGGVEYRVHGTVTLAGSFPLTLPYSRSGRFDLLSDGLALADTAADRHPSACVAPTRL